MPLPWGRNPGKGKNGDFEGTDELDSMGPRGLAQGRSCVPGR